MRTAAVARNLALLRRISLNLLRADASLQVSLNRKCKITAWDGAFMVWLF
jgi:hypothetical protein